MTVFLHNMYITVYNTFHIYNSSDRH